MLTMCEYCTLIKEGTQAICSCDCHNKMASGKVLLDIEARKVRCKSCGHQLGLPVTEFDKMIAKRNQQRVFSKDGKRELTLEENLKSIEEKSEKARR